ncbi:hypothetical protein D9757_001735 [Collybiopsis confluens]|uniref:3-hydroxyisobutyrate dehydrogenase n=1 Tax=Collybiopsis confluens TaxID=2823264 RepID=A0A8H5MFC1_9AGAR|nr:hypothetical protein D9757_001735 [Collybiopsis confluens]
MKASLRCLESISRHALRSKSTSFIGLGLFRSPAYVHSPADPVCVLSGRMGHEMAYNLFSKQFTQANESRFVVCDAIPESSQSFCANFVKQYPGAKIEIASTPEEATLASETIVTMLPSSPQVLTVYNNGIVPTLQKLPADQARNTLCIDSTTLDVDVARAVARDVAKVGSQMVDAPVSGGSCS